MNTGKNRSSAVMQQRSEPHDSLDDFPTPPWATRALIEHVLHPLVDAAAMKRDDVAWDPACNRGFMLRGLDGYFRKVWGSDIHDYGIGRPVSDFLLPSMGDQSVNFDRMTECVDRPGWIITNPPFRLAEQFIKWCLLLGTYDGFAMLTRTSFLEGVGRHRDLFTNHPPSIVAQFAERVPMVKGRCDPKASTATSYCWLVWLSVISDRDGGPTKFVWIPPCRKQLEREGDYA